MTPPRTWRSRRTPPSACRWRSWASSSPSTTWASSKAGEVMRFWPLIPMLVGAAYIVQGREAASGRSGPRGSRRHRLPAANLGVFHVRPDRLPAADAGGGRPEGHLQAAATAPATTGRACRTRPGLPPAPGAPPPFTTLARRRSAGVPLAGRGRADARGRPWPRRPAARRRRRAVLERRRAARPQAGGPQIVRLFAILWGADRRVRGPVSHVEVSAMMGGCDSTCARRCRRSIRSPSRCSRCGAASTSASRPAGSSRSRRGRSWAASWTIRRPPALPSHRVILRGMAFMGGVEIKN